MVSVFHSPQISYASIRSLRQVDVPFDGTLFHYLPLFPGPSQYITECQNVAMQ